MSQVRMMVAVAVAVAALVALGGRAEAGFVLSVEAAGVQQSSVSGVTTESFDNIAAGKYTTNASGQSYALSTAVGTLSTPGLAVVAADLYGGAGGTGRYFAVGAQSGTLGTVLTLKGAMGYFGFWWSAADAGNQISFLSGGSVVASFNPSTVLGALGSDYLGNPTTNFKGQDSGEKFAYLNISGTNGSTFDQIVFRNASSGSGFEADNFSVRAAAPTASPGIVIVGGIASVPEPSSLVLCGIAGLAGLVRLARVRRQGGDSPIAG